MAPISAILVALYLAAAASAFSSHQSSFVGRASSVCSRDELTTELSCPLSRSDPKSYQRGTGMSMPPFLKKLGLGKRVKSVFGRGVENEDSSKAIAILEEDFSEAVVVSEKVNKVTNDTVTIDEECVLPEDVKEMSETEKLLKQVKEAGTAGVISYALWELGFWTISIPVCVVGYREVTGHWPDFADKEDLEKLGAEAFAFVNFARFAVPLRIGLALSTTPWIQENIVDKFMTKEEPPICEPEDEMIA